MKGDFCRTFLTFFLTIKLHCCAGEASTEPKKIADHYKASESPLHRLPDSVPEYEDLNGLVENLGDHLNRFHKSEENGNSVTQSLGPSGGVLELDDCSIYFPKNSLRMETLLHAKMDVAPIDFTKGKVPITPLLRLSPNAELNAPATVRITTWFTPGKSAPVQIYFKENENATWEELQQSTPARLCGNNKIEFSITKFCSWCASCDPEQVAKGSFRVACLLMCHEQRKLLTNRIVLACVTQIEAVKNEMKPFERVCTVTSQLEVKVGDEIRVCIENIKDGAQSDHREIPREAPITMDFLRNKIHDTMDFPLPRNCTGLVEFRHVVRLYKGFDLIGQPIVHDTDRIYLGQ